MHSYPTVPVKASYPYLKISLFWQLLSLLIFNLAFQQDGYAQKKQTIKGTVLESGTATPVANVSIFYDGQSTSSNSKGEFRLLTDKQEINLRATHIAFDTLQTSLQISPGKPLVLFLHPKASLMQEVQVSGSRYRPNATSIAPNVQVLSKTDLEKAPAFLGQRDLIKALQTLPGTGKGGEGNSGFYVRGGTAGQNLTIFNDAVIYNPSHLLGFFSVFNSGAVENVKLYKSAIPAEYGGRLSSIIEVNSSTKVSDSLSAEGDLSPFSANATVDVPLTKNWSVTASARKTFMNQTVWPLLNSAGVTSGSFNNMKYDFHDLNLNSTVAIGNTNKISLSAYTGSDDFGFGIERFTISNGMDWKNSAVSLSWRNTLNQRMVLQSSASFSGYRFNFGMTQDKYDARISSRLKDYNLKSVLNIYQAGHHIKAGIQYTDHQFSPNTPSITSAGLVYDFGQANIYYSDESAVFLSDEFELSERIGIYAGSRFTLYRHKGPYSYTAEDDRLYSYSKGKTVASYLFFEPSLTARYLIGANSSVKLSFSRNVQPLHLISVTAVNFPADFWMPSLNSIPPEKGYQFSAGYFKDFGKEKQFESYIDLYYKDMKGLVEFSGGIMNLIDNLKIEQNLLFGSGNAYGTEFFLKKKKGRLTGWLGYTISKSDRSFELINNSSAFPAKYDRRHDLSIVGNYELNRKWSVSGSFTYATGNAYTKPVSRYLVAGNIVNEYGPFNGGRMPAYHRMDFSAVYLLKARKGSRSELVFSVYNLYNRQNPIYIYFMAEGNLEKQQVSIRPKSVALLPVLPAVNYKFSFK